MTSSQNRAISAWVVALLVLAGAFLIVVLDAHARVDTAMVAVDEAFHGETGGAAEYLADTARSPWFLSRLVGESLVNDTAPRVYFLSDAQSVELRFGAFGQGADQLIPGRPWTIPLAAVPFAIVLALSIAVVLVKADHWDRRSERGIDG